MTASSFLVPAAGLITAPLLARALSTDGRGELAAAIAPAGLMLAAATLGLPDALTYHIAKRPELTRRALGLSSLITLGLGLICLLATVLAQSFLANGDSSLARLIIIGTSLTVPALLVNVMRGAAVGRQMWKAVAVERLIITTIRVVGFGLLFATDELTVMAGVLVNTITPIVAGIVYWPLLRRPPQSGVNLNETSAQSSGEKDHSADDQNSERTLTLLVKYGSKVWLGSVASMLLSRAAQLLMTPLSSVEDLGLYTVASTVSDLPLIVALAIQGALFGVNSKSRDARQVTLTSRLTLTVGLAGCIVLGGTLRWWIGPLFGPEFRPAFVPALILLVSALICIPGLMASSALSAWGRPGLRSFGLGVTLVANIGTFVALVPHSGVYGACWTSLASNVVMSTFMILAARRTIKVRGRDFWLIRPADVRLLRFETMRLVDQARARLGR